MTMGTRGKTTNWTRETVAVQAQAERESIVGEMPGKIVAYDAPSQTATVQPLYEPLHNGVSVKMPELLEVPVRFSRAGNGALTFPVQAGDRVSLRPQMRGTEKYHAGDEHTPTDTRSFNLSDMEAYMDGGESLADPIQNFDDANTHLRFDTAGQYGLRGSKDGKIKLEGNEGDIYDLLVQVVELLAADTLVINYGSSAGSGHALEFKAQYQAIADKLRAMALTGG